MKILVFAVALAIAVFATPARAGQWWPCNPWYCVSTAPVGTPYPVYRPPRSFFIGRDVIVQERTRIIVRERWHIRCDNRTGYCWRVR